MLLKNHIKIFRLHIPAGIQIQMQYRVLNPILLKFLYSQTFKQFLLTIEIGLHGRYKKALAESSWTAEKIISAGSCQSMYQCRFIYIDITVLADFLKILYAYWVQHIFIGFCYGQRYKFIATITHLAPSVL